MTDDEKPTNTLGDAEFFFSVIEIEMEHWENDLAGTKAVLMTLGCSAQKADAPLAHTFASDSNPGLLRNQKSEDIAEAAATEVDRSRRCLRQRTFIQA